MLRFIYFCSWGQFKKVPYFRIFHSNLYPVFLINFLHSNLLWIITHFCRFWTFWDRFWSLFFVYLRSKIIFKFCYFGLFWTTNFSLLNNFSRKNFYHPRPQTAGPCQKDVGPHDPPPPANDPPWPAYWTSIAEKNDDQKPHRRVWHLHTPTPRTHYWTTKGEKQGEQDHEWEFNHLLGYKFES